MELKIINKLKESNFPYWILYIKDKGYFPYDMKTFKTKIDRENFLKPYKKRGVKIS